MAIIQLDGRTNLTWDELKTVVAARLGKRSNLDEEIQNELIMAQIELEQRAYLPEWLTVTSSLFGILAAPSEDQPSTAVLTSGNARATYDDGALYLKDAQADSGKQYSELKRVSFDELREEAICSPGFGKPKYYAIRTLNDDVTIELFPGVSADDVASSRFSLVWRGKAPWAIGGKSITGNEATATDTSAWFSRVSALLIEMACFRVALISQNPRLPVFQAERDRLISELEKLITAEEVRDMELFMGGS